MSQHEIPIGTRVEIALEWPLMLNGSTPLQLTATGNVVRSEDRNFVVLFENCEFRTMKLRTEQRMAVG